MHSLFLMNCYFQYCTFKLFSIGGAVFLSDPIVQLPRFVFKSRSLIDEPDLAPHLHPLSCAMLQK